jgi:hypothetical protein
MRGEDQKIQGQEMHKAGMLWRGKILVEQRSCRLGHQRSKGMGAWGSRIMAEHDNSREKEQDNRGAIQ